jgi:hypothetical protein
MYKWIVAVFRVDTLLQHVRIEKLGQFLFLALQRLVGLGKFFFLHAVLLGIQFTSFYVAWMKLADRDLKIISIFSILEHINPITIGALSILLSTTFSDLINVRL